MTNVKIAIGSGLVAALVLAQIRPERNWPAYGGGPQGTRYSDLRQINRSNVAKLQVAWTYDTADGTGDPQTQPIVVHGVLYGLTPRHKVIALDAATGKLLWRFDSGVVGTRAESRAGVLVRRRRRANFRGRAELPLCAGRATGKPIPSFGNDGRIDLREDLGRDPAKAVDRPDHPRHHLQGPADRRRPDSRSAARAARRYSRLRRPHRQTALDVFTPFRIPASSATKPGRKTRGRIPARPTTGRAWRSIEKRGIVYVPTGSAASDFYGADRLGDDLFANMPAGAERRNRRAHLALSGGAARSSGIAIFPRRRLW